MALTAAIVSMARAARAEGVLLVRMRRGPVAELQLLPPDPPALTVPQAQEDPSLTPEERRRHADARRDSWMVDS